MSDNILKDMWDSFMTTMKAPPPGSVGTIIGSPTIGLEGMGDVGAARMRRLYGENTARSDDTLDEAARAKRDAVATMTDKLVQQAGVDMVGRLKRSNGRASTFLGGPDPLGLGGLR